MYAAVPSRRETTLQQARLLSASSVPARGQGPLPAPPPPPGTHRDFWGSPQERFVARLVFQRSALPVCVDCRGPLSASSRWVTVRLLFPSRLVWVWQSLGKVSSPPAMTAVRATPPPPRVAGSLSPSVWEQKVNNCDVAPWTCPSGSAGAPPCSLPPLVPNFQI